MPGSQSISDRSAPTRAARPDRKKWPDRPRLGGSVALVKVLAEDLEAVVNRVRAAAAAAGELRPPLIGPVESAVPESVRLAVADDLTSGAYHRAAQEAVAGDPDLTQG